MGGVKAGYVQEAGSSLCSTDVWWRMARGLLIVEEGEKAEGRE